MLKNTYRYYNGQSAAKVLNKNKVQRLSRKRVHY